MKIAGSQFSMQIEEIMQNFRGSIENEGFVMYVEHFKRGVEY